MKAVKNVLGSYIKLCYVYVKFKWANQSYSSLKISQLINVQWRTCDKNGKQIFQWELEKLWSFDKARNDLIEKNRDMSSEKYILLDFAKYLSFSEVQKNSKIVNV